MDPNYQQPGYQPPYYPPAPPSNTMAIISLISSIAGVTVVPTFGSILGLILGYVAKKQIAESQGTQGGGGMATAGIIIGWIGIGLGLLLACLVAASMIFGFALPLGLGGCGLCAAMGNLQNLQ